MGNGEFGIRNSEKEMGNREWGIGNGEWGMGNGEWGMGNGEWGMGNGSKMLPLLTLPEAPKPPRAREAPKAHQHRPHYNWL